MFFFYFASGTVVWFLITCEFSKIQEMPNSSVCFRKWKEVCSLHSIQLIAVVDKSQPLRYRAMEIMWNLTYDFITKTISIVIPRRINISWVPACNTVWLSTSTRKNTKCMITCIIKTPLYEDNLVASCCWLVHILCWFIPCLCTAALMFSEQVNIIYATSKYPNP